MRFRNALLACALVVACSSLSGCYDRTELEEQAFLVSLGIDLAPKGLIQLTARLAVPSKLSGSGNGGSGSGGAGGSTDSQSGTPLVSASGRTIPEAVSNMNTGIERMINLSHLSAIIFSESAAKKGLLPYLRTLVRYREFRRTLYVFVAKGELGKVFREDKPVLETSVTRMIEDLHESSRRTGYAPSVQMHQFLGSLETPNEDPIMPILAVNAQVASESETGGGSPRLKTHAMDLTPGRVGRSGANPVECVGTAVFRGDRLVGMLDGSESRYLQLLMGSLQRTVISVKTPGAKGYLSLAVRYAEPLTVRLQLTGRAPRLHIMQSFEAELIGDQAAETFTAQAERKNVERALAARIKRDELRLLEKVYRDMRAEPFHYFSYARGSFPTFAAMRRYDWHSRLPLVQVTVDTESNLRRLGLQLNPPVNESV